MSANGAATLSATAIEVGNAEAAKPANSQPTWRNMPHKDQLAILALSRFVDFFQQAAIQTYVYYQLKSFKPDISEAELSRQTGTLLAAFTFAQIVSSFLWGLAADHPAVGRKLVLQIGLIGTSVGCVGVAFSRSFSDAVFWRLMTGTINATVGSARSMLGERIPKPWHSRAFLLLPAAFNLANIAGPLLSGMLVEPAAAHPRLFGPGSVVGGSQGVGWMKAYPYALPNLLCAALLLTESTIVHLFLKETLQGKRPFKITSWSPRDWFLTAKAYAQGIGRRAQRSQQESLLTRMVSNDMELVTTDGHTTEELQQRLPLRRIWTTNVLWTLLSIGIFDFHLGAFHNLWILMLSTPRDYVPKSESSQIQSRSVFKFSSGLAFTPVRVGQALSIIGILGVTLQFLMYPKANKRFGLMKCFRASLFLFPVAYYLAPFISQLPSTSPSPSPASGPLVWLGIIAILFIHVTARTFALPAVIILLNNSSPHPSVLGTINGLGQGCSALFRTLGPYASSFWFNTWRERGVVGMSWWIVASIAAAGCIASFWVRDGSAQQIILPGERLETKEHVVNVGSADGR